MKSKILTFIFSLLFIGCNKYSSKIYDKDSVNITIFSENYQEKIYYSQLFDSVKYIILDNRDDCLIGEIAKIVHYDKRFYILDVQQMILFAFSETGQFEWKIDKRGNGPGEYRYLMDFDINQNRLYLFDRRNQILEYDLNGNFVKKYEINIPGVSFLINNGHFYFYTCNSTSETGDYSLLIMDDYGQKFKNGIPITQKNLLNKCVIFNHSKVFYRYGDKNRFYMPLETNVYSIAEDSISVQYRISINNKNIPENFFDRNTYEDLTNTSYAYGMHTFWENDSFLSFEVMFDKRYWTVLFSKKEDKPAYGIFYDDIAYCFPSIQVSNNDFAIGFRSMYELHSEYTFAQEIKESRENTILEDIVKNTNEEDNPVLLIYFFKK